MGGDEVRTGPWHLFAADLAWSGQALGQAPMLVVASVGLYLPSLIPAEFMPRWWVPFGMVTAFVTAGFYGTQRIWFLRVLHGGAVMTWREAMVLSRAYWGRFLLLGLMALVFVVPAGILVGIVGALTEHGGHVHAGWPYLAVVLVGILLADVALTFVVPALALSVTAPLGALRIGLRMLRVSWPYSAGYALAPGLLATGIAFALPRSVIGPDGVVAIGAAGVVMGLWFKGAIVAFYDRVVPGIPESGSAYGWVGHMVENDPTT